MNSVQQTNQQKQKKKKKWKLPSAVMIIFGVFLFIVFLTWVIPHQPWTNDSDNPLDKDIAPEWFNFFESNWYVSETGVYGILNIPLVLIAGFFSAWGVILYLLAIGAFVQIMLDSGTLESGTIVLINKMKGKEIWLLPTFFIFFAFGGTTFGMQEETLGLIPLIVPFLVLAGFDTMTGMLVIVLGTTSGIAASVLDPFSVGVMAESLDASISDGIVIRIIMFIVFIIMGSAYVTWYGMRVKKDKKHSVEPENIDKNLEWAQTHLAELDHEKDKLKTNEKWAIAVFGAVFGIMIFSLLPWTTWFPVLEDNYAWSFFSALFYDGATFGTWYFLQISLLFFVGAFIIGLIFKMNKKQILSAFKTGMLGMVGVAIILSISRSVALVLEYSGLTVALVEGLLNGNALTNANPITVAWILFPIFLILAIFIPSTSGLAGVTGPLIASFIGDNHASIVAVMVTYPIAQGVINMFSPTTGLVVAQAEESQVSFTRAVTPLFKFAVMTAIVGMAIVTVSLLFVA